MKRIQLENKLVICGVRLTSFWVGKLEMKMKDHFRKRNKCGEEEKIVEKLFDRIKKISSDIKKAQTALVRRKS
jgi:hypothetical protein